MCREYADSFAEDPRVNQQSALTLEFQCENFWEEGKGTKYIVTVSLEGHPSVGESRKNIERIPYRQGDSASVSNASAEMRACVSVYSCVNRSEEDKYPKRGINRETRVK